jgi:hypothetical protein
MIKKNFTFMFWVGLLFLLSSPTYAAQKITPDLFIRFETHLDRLADRLAEYAMTPSFEDSSRKVDEELKELSAYNEEILSAFGLIEKELLRISAKKTVKTALKGRQQNFVEHYRQNYAKLISGLTNVKNLSDSTASREELKEALLSLISLIRKTEISRRQPLDPYNLPVGSVSFDDTYFDLPPQIEGDLSAYRDETPGVKFTEEVEKVAESLKRNPVRMAQWVKDNIEYTPLYGAVKGSELCLLDRNGNDYDQASALIALLRFSGIPARYVYGKIQVEEDKLVSWLGTENIEMAWEIMRSHGIPIKDGVFDHVWVEAYFDNPSQWGIDPSFKQYKVIKIPRRGERELSLSDTFTFQESILGKGRDYIIAKRTIYQPVDIDLPYDVKRRLWAGSTLGSEFTFRVRVNLSSSADDPFFTKEFHVGELARREVSLIYLPAGFQDGAIMKGLLSLNENPDSPVSFFPAYLIRVRPHLLVGNRIVLSGEPVGLGEKQNLSLTLIAPRLKQRTLRHTILAGSQTAIRIMAGGTSRFSTFAEDTYGYSFKEKLLKEPLEYLQQKLGVAFLNKICLDYISQSSQLRNRLADHKGIVVTGFFTEGVASRGVQTGYLMGRPASFEYSGVQLDIQADLVCAAYGNSNWEKNRLLAAIGSYGSMLEHYVLENASADPTPAVSAVKIISKAEEIGIPVRVLKPGDEQSLSFLPGPLRSDISGALHRRREVHIPESPVKIGDWEGYGYILIDPVTGERGYMINGLGAGLSGNVGATSKITMPKGTLAKFIMVILVLGVVILIVVLV